MSDYSSGYNLGGDSVSTSDKKKKGKSNILHVTYKTFSDL